MLDRNRLNAYRVEKQNIWKKSQDYISVLRNQMALHSTDYLTPYISLWVRVRDFDAKEFYEEMMQTREAARVRAFRGTLFVIHSEWIGSVLVALDDFLSQRQREALRYIEKQNINLDLADKIVATMAGGNFFSSKELKQILDVDFKSNELTLLIRYLEFACKISRANGRNPLDRVVKYGLWEDCLPHISLVEKAVGLEKVLLQYIQQFGPVCLNDIDWWFPLTKTVAKKALSSIDDKVEKLIVDEKEYFMTKSDYKNFQSFLFDDNWESVSFLPYEDHFTKAYIDRDWFLSKEAITLVTEEGPMMRGQIMPSIWLNDQIIGRWYLKWQNSKKSAAFIQLGEIHNREKLPQSVLQKIEDKRAELEAFLNDQIVPMLKK